MSHSPARSDMSSSDRIGIIKTRSSKPASLAGAAAVPPVHRRPFLKSTLVVSLFLLALYTFSSSALLPPLSSTTTISTSSSSPSSLSYPKIYVYNLPHKFTTGVIQSYLLARNRNSLPKNSKVKYPGHQHSAEWHLFTDLQKRSINSPITVVDDPDVADLFYVPFFSSLSLVVNPPSRDTNAVSPHAYSDERMQEELMEWLEAQPYWRRNDGRDHVFICQDPNALYKLVDRIKNAVLLVSDFGRLRPDQGSLVKDVILPYSHRINPYKGEIGVENRSYLLFFMGNRYRKEGGKIRDTLFQILENEKDVVIKHGAQSRESRRMATQGMHSSKFCLHPAGDTPSACRLFDAIVSLCVPVIVSNYIELPFEDVIDYKRIAVFVDTRNSVRPGHVTSILRKISTKKLLEYQKELQSVKRYFEYEDPNGTVPEIWRQVASKVPLIKLMINRHKRLVKRELDGPDCSCICSGQNGTSTVR